MRLDNAREQAAKVKTRKQAARLHNNLEYELALGEHPYNHQQHAEDALADLKRRYPGVEQDASQIDTPPQLSRSASQQLEQDSPGARQRVARRRQTRTPARRRGPRAITRRRVASFANQASGGWSSTLGDIIVWGVGLSIFYLLLTKAKTTGKLFLGLTNTVQAIVNPRVDPLNPTGAKPPAAATAPGARQVAATAPYLGNNNPLLGLSQVPGGYTP